MKRWSVLIILLLVFAAVLITGCPSPVNSILSDNTEDQTYETSAKVVVNAAGTLIFIEEDGSETPILPMTDDSWDAPVELIDYTVLDDNPEAGRSSSAAPRIRCVVVGRRNDGRSGVWVIYRHSGVVVLPNENGVEDSALLDLVEVNGSPWLGDDWVYDAKAVSDDGLVIVGQLSRPDGWEYLSGVVPEPSIGVWWNLHYLDGRLVVSRARPILMMNEPVDDSSNARCSYQHRYREWLDELIEWIQAFFLDQSWNYLADATGFVSPGDVVGGIPDGSYVVTGPNKYGVDAWAWITAGSVYNIEDAPVIPDDPGANDPPWPVTGPGGDIIMTSANHSFMLEISDDTGTVITDPADFDPDGDMVEFIPTLLSIDDPSKEPVVTISSSGEFAIVWDSTLDGSFIYAKYSIAVSDGENTTLPENTITIFIY